MVDIVQIICMFAVPAIIVIAGCVMVFMHEEVTCRYKYSDRALDIALLSFCYMMICLAVATIADFLTS